MRADGLNNRRKLLVALGAGALLPPVSAFAQMQGSLRRIGSLDLGSHQAMVDSGRYAAFVQGLSDHGYVEGRNVVIDARYADGNAKRLDALAAELLRLKCDLILCTGSPAIHAVKRATTTVPIVVTATTDPVGDGFARSLAHPGGNITGMTTGSADIAGKWIELLVVAVPKLKSIAVISNPGASMHAPLLQTLTAAAQRAGQRILPVSVRTREDIDRGLELIARERAEGAVILPDSFLLSQRAHIAALALKHRLPSINSLAGYAEVGGLMNYGADINDNFRRAGVFIDKILKGTRPGDIPFEQPTRYYLVVNGKTAKSLGINMEGELLARTDRVVG